MTQWQSYPKFLSREISSLAEAYIPIHCYETTKTLQKAVSQIHPIKINIKRILDLNVLKDTDMYVHIKKTTTHSNFRKSYIHIPI